MELLLLLLLLLLFNGDERECVAFFARAIHDTAVAINSTFSFSVSMTECGGEDGDDDDEGEEEEDDFRGFGVVESTVLQSMT